MVLLRCIVLLLIFYHNLVRFFLLFVILVSGMQSLLEEIMASPGLMENLLSGPYVSSLLNCLSQNPDLAAQVTCTQLVGV